MVDLLFSSTLAGPMQIPIRCGIAASALLFAAGHLFADSPPAEETPAEVVLKFDEAEYKEWQSARARIEDRCAELRRLTFAWGFDRPIEVQTPTERKRLTKRVFRAFKVTEDDFPVLKEFTKYFPEVDRVTLGFDASVKKIPVELLVALQQMPRLKAVSFLPVSGFVWGEDAMRALVALDATEELRIAGAFPDEHFVEIRKLQKLRTVSLTGNYSPRIFETLAELPHLTTLNLGAGGRIGREKLRPQTIDAIAKFEGRRMVLSFTRGEFHADVVREFIKLRSTRRLAIVANLRDATLEHFEGIETIPDLEGLEVRILNNHELDAQLDKRIAVRKRKVAANGRRAARRRRLAKEHPEQPTLLLSPAMSPQQAEEWMSRMASEGRKFDPSELLTYGDVGLKAILQRIFPEIVSPTKDVAAKDIQRLMKQLDDEQFQVRDEATKELIAKGEAYRDLLKQAKANSRSIEVQTRCSFILTAWQEAAEKADGNVLKSDKFVVAWQEYLNRFTEFTSDKLLVESIVKAMKARIDLTDRSKLLEACITPITKCIDDELYEELAVLCDDEDTAVPIFILKRLGGRAGNSYVTPVHKAAIVSGRKELVKAGFSCMPSPVWDRSFKPFLRDHYQNLFRDPSKSKFASDPEFLRLQAFSAAREHNVEGARDYLIAQIDSEDTQHAVRSISMLCDTAYEQRRLDQKLRQASERLLASSEPERRIAGIQILWTYRANDATYESLLKAVEDEDEKVWQHATNALLQHRAWQKRFPTRIDIVARLSQRAAQLGEDAELQKRLQTITSLFQTPIPIKRSRDSKYPRWVRRPH